MVNVDGRLIFDAFVVFIGGYLISRFIVFTFGVDRMIIEAGNRLREWLGMSPREDWV